VWGFTYTKTTLLIPLCKNCLTGATKLDTYTSTLNAGVVVLASAARICCATPHIENLPFDRKWTLWIRFENRVSWLFV
jgi:hypothetical protein